MRRRECPGKGAIVITAKGRSKEWKYVASSQEAAESIAQDMTDRATEKAAASPRKAPKKPKAKKAQAAAEERKSPQPEPERPLGGGPAGRI